ncbi:branched-chain amino acid ABC transporter substrate-binding protein [Burkholderia pyrrocinia]|uniref:branched-chain amino acid ABC transporter substrate-binding protein n=1 Tax=Burkholderia pyrrocinia TaxID=60550 RepID=UPI002AB0C6E3|nr:branched-chain amino acid ABC transporter substrate-binding protein [Burkholderia pyrrocinia]
MRILAAATGISLALAVTCVQADQIVKIGFAGPTTGTIAHIGKDSEWGVRLAIDEANQQNVIVKGERVRFEVDAQDDMADPKTAVTVAQKLIDDHIVGVVGHINSGATLAASKIYAAAGVPQISPSSTNPLFTRQGLKTAFRTIGDDRDVADTLAGYVIEKMQAKRVVVVDDRTAYGQTFGDAIVERLTKRGVTPVGREYVTDHTVDFRGVLTGVKAKQPQVLIYAGVDAQAGPMRKQMVSLGMKDVMLASCTIETDRFIQLAGYEAAEGSISSESGYPLGGLPKGDEFMKRFAKYGKPVLFSPYAYDATWAIVKAIQIANSTAPTDITAALHKVRFDGITGEISFDDKGDLRTAHVSLFKERGGKWDAIETVSVGDRKE